MNSNLVVQRVVPESFVVLNSESCNFALLLVTS
uniref:Uncharacterized protein n=1 Tax=Arundo donax TaxID=35708 RepID=A0A0A9E8N5_ARUDO